MSDSLLYDVTLKLINPICRVEPLYTCFEVIRYVDAPAQIRCSSTVSHIRKVDGEPVIVVLFRGTDAELVQFKLTYQDWIVDITELV